MPVLNRKVAPKSNSCECKMTENIDNIGNGYEVKQHCLGTSYMMSIFESSELNKKIA